MFRWLRQPHVGLHALALIALLGMYFSNSDMGGDPKSPRGDGVYRPVLARADGHLMWLQLSSLILDGDLDYSNQMKAFNPIWPPAKTATGRQGIVHPIGPALVWSIPFLVAHGGAKLANALGASIPEHGYTPWHMRIVFTTAPLFSFAAVLLGFWLARRLCGGRWGPLYASLAVLFGTSITVYATYAPWSAHPMDAAATGAFLAVWAATLGDLRARRFALLGALLGLCALIRITGFALAVAPGLELLVLFLRSPRELPRLVAGALLLAGAAVAVFSPQMVAWKVVYGEWLTSPMGEGFMRLDQPQFADLLFSSRNGWFATTPIAYAGVLGVFLLLLDRRARLVAAGLLAVLALQLWINASVYDWWAGASFGARRLCSMTSVLVVGLAAWFRLLDGWARRLPLLARHGLALAVLGWFVNWNLSAVHVMRHGRPGNAQVRTSCCRQLPDGLEAIAQPVYDAVGNPFQLPASLLFALRHRVEIQRWDQVAGAYMIEPGWYDYRSGAYKKSKVVWRIASPNIRGFVLGGVDATGKMTERRARVLIPLLHAEPHRFTVTLVPGGPPQLVRLSLDGKPRTEAVLASKMEVTFDAPVDAGRHVLEIEALEPGATVDRVMVGYP